MALPLDRSRAVLMKPDEAPATKRGRKDSISPRRVRRAEIRHPNTPPPTTLLPHCLVFFSATIKFASERERERRRKPAVSSTTEATARLLCLCLSRGCVVSLRCDWGPGSSDWVQDSFHIQVWGGPVINCAAQQLTF